MFKQNDIIKHRRTENKMRWNNEMFIVIYLFQFSDQLINLDFF